MDRGDAAVIMAVTNQRFRPGYHLASPGGWVNDPNGFAYFDGQCHLFFQHNPKEAKWGPMHWGHSVTKDFVTWEHLPTALFPDQPYENGLGCFSGTALAKDGKLHLMYTAAWENGKNMAQQQCLAVSADGIGFVKHPANPVLPKSQIPHGYSDSDFRDPKLFFRNGAFYCLVGARKRFGEILLYRSKNMESWEFVGPVVNGLLEAEGVLECPDLVRLGGRDVLIFSPQNLKQEGHMYQNAMSSVYMVGELCLATGRFMREHTGEIDGGYDFYAPQTVTLPDGRVVLTAWMNMWGRTYPTAGDGWTGAFALPRELRLEGGKLFQSPVREIENYRENPIHYSRVRVGEGLELEGVHGSRIELVIDVDLHEARRFGIRLFSGRGFETVLCYEQALGIATLDRSNSGEPVACEGEPFRRLRVDAPDGRLHLRLFLDTSSVEVFLQNGAGTMTSTAYPKKGCDGIEFFSEGGEAEILSLRKYEIGGKCNETE